MELKPEEVLAVAATKIVALLDEIRTEMCFQNAMVALRTIYLDSQGVQIGKDEPAQARGTRKLQNLSRLLMTAQSYLDSKLQRSAQNMLQAREIQLDGLKKMKKNFVVETLERMQNKAAELKDAVLEERLVILKQRAAESPVKIEQPDEFYPAVGKQFAQEVEDAINDFFRYSDLPEDAVEEVSALRIGVLEILKPSNLVVTK